MIQRTLVFLSLIVLTAGLAEAAVHALTPSRNFEIELHTLLAEVSPGDTIELSEGHFKISRELVLVTRDIKLTGQGPQKTLLDFSSQSDGAQGILVRANNVSLSQFSVLNPSGDGIVVRGARRISISHVNVQWSSAEQDGNAGSRGGYGIYPVLSKQILIEFCRVEGAREAGIYVGQSADALVKENYTSDNTV